MTVQIGSLEFHLIVQDNEGKPHPTTLWFLSEEDKKKNLLFRLCHVKAAACQEESTPQAAKHACFHVCVRVHVGVPASARGMQNPEGNARFPQSLPVSCTEAGSVAEPEARRVK